MGVCFCKNGDNISKTNSNNDDCDFLKNYDVESKRLILDTVLKAHDIEWERTRDIESKASNTVGFVGVIFSLTIMTLASIIVSTDEVTRTKLLFSSIYSPIAIVIILSLMFFSVFCGLKALSVKEWWFLFIDEFLKKCKSETKSSDDLFKMMLEGYEDGTKINDGLNTKIASYLKWAHTLFLLSLMILIIYFTYILDLVY